ncbi:hypothetical protein M9Y10_036581 [Tritrichomonas musculus]|uniref:Uncharacterized protein n=1 Tax=Tritrichomonas musculus TaxID=1915356 RepID=A0ABR2GUN7_9EUKA
MKPLKDIPVLSELKKYQELFQDNTKYSMISQFLPTNEDANNLFTSFKSRLKEYYEDFEAFQNKTLKTGFFKIKSAFMKMNEKNYYYLYDDFSYSTDFFKKETDAINSIIYSPFSINFFSKVFKNLLNDYFTGKEPVPEDEEQLLTKFSRIGELLLENMKYCPSFLKQLFTDGYTSGKKNVTPTEIYEKIVVEQMFENPHLFGILNFGQSMKTDQKGLNILKQAIKNFKIEGLFVEQPLTFLPGNKRESKFPLGQLKGSFSPLLLINFRDLLKKGKKIPDQISSEICKKTFEKQIECLLLDSEDPNYSQQIELFKKLKGFLSQQKKIDFLLNGLSLISNVLKLNELRSIINETLFNFKGFITIFQNSKIQVNNYKNYINNPRLFMNDMEEVLGKKRKAENDDDNESGNQLMISTIAADSGDPFFLNILMLNGMTMTEFLKKRPALRIADHTFKNKNEYLDIREDFVFEPLIKMKKNDFSLFADISNDFVDSFSMEMDPFNLARSISKAYTRCMIATKAYMSADSGDDNFNNNTDFTEDEKNKFIVTLFWLTKPSHVVSTYVYLYEFLLSPEYLYGVFSGKKNDHLDVTGKIFSTCIFAFSSSNLDAFYIAEFCKICKMNVNLVIENKAENLDKLADIVSLNDDEKRNYSQMFTKLVEDPILTGQNNKKNPLFTFRIYQSSGDDPTIWICNVVGFDNKGFDDIPLDSESDLAEYLYDKYGQ